MLEHSVKYIVSLYTLTAPTWPPTQHREGTKRDENHNESGHVDNYSYVKEELVSSVSVQQGSITNMTVGWVAFIMKVFWGFFPQTAIFSS